MLKRVMLVLTLVLAASGARVTRQGAAPADLVLLDAKILTVDEQFTEARALAVREGRFVAVGSNEDIKAYVGNATRVIEGRGRTVVPGLIDTHVHALGVAAAETEQPFRNLTSVAELQDGSAPKPGAGKTAGSGRRVCIQRGCRSAASRRARNWTSPRPSVRSPSTAPMPCRSTPLRSAPQGLPTSTPDPPGGAIVKDSSGEPTGLLRNVGALLARFHSEAAAVPPLEALERVHQQYIATGITSVIERAATVDGYKAYDALKHANRLKVRATITIRIPRPDDAAEVERFVIGLPFRFGEGDDWLKVGPLKIFTDGGILIGTAYMREPYGAGAHQLYAVDDPKYRGFLTLTPEQIASAIMIGHRHGWQMVAHVTGDAGVDIVLDAFEAAQKQQPAPDRRHTLIHAYFVHPESAARAARLGVLVDTQPAWYYKDADALATGLGPERLAHFIGLHTLRQAGVDVAINTDHMFGLDRDDALNPFNPFLTIYAATTRRTESGQVIGGDEVVSRQEALRMMTSAAARFSFDEKTRGSIERGKLADFVVLDDDILTCSPDRLRAIRPDLTVIDGRIAFDRSAK